MDGERTCRWAKMGDVGPWLGLAATLVGGLMTLVIAFAFILPARQGPNREGTRRVP